MIHQLQPPWGGAIELDNGYSVFRAVLYKRWLTDSGEIQSGAFLRRDRDTDGVSVNDPKSCDAQELCKKFRECFGILKLEVGTIRSVDNLDVRPDSESSPDNCGHGNIIGLPAKGEDPAHAEYLAGELAKKAVIEWVPGS